MGNSDKMLVGHILAAGGVGMPIYWTAPNRIGQWMGFRARSRHKSLSDSTHLFNGRFIVKFDAGGPQMARQLTQV
jgi:hypothetical protein